MRTSGATNEGAMTVVPIAVAVLIVVVLLGGPTEALKVIETALQTAVAWVWDASAAVRSAL